MSVSDIHAFNTADWALDNSFMVQLQDPGEPYTATCPFYLLDHPEGVVVVDTGVSHDLLDDPANYGRWGAAFMEAFLPGIEWDESMHPSSHLEAAGYSPEEVDTVVMTHLHSDHAGHIDTFPDAEFIVQLRELRYAWWPIPAQGWFYLDGDFGVLRSDDYDVTVIEGEYDVLGDGSIVTVPTPGHTPGHQSVVVDKGDETVILGGDVAHQQVGFQQELVASFNWNTQESIDSIRKIKAVAKKKDAPVRLVHDRDDFDALSS